MQADYSVELGREDPALELPWKSADGTSQYRDLKSHPDLVLQIREAIDFPPLSTFLTRLNATGFPLQTAKCDAWYSRELSPEEEVYNAALKCVCYVDVLFMAEAQRLDFEKHEALAKSLCALLHRAPEIAAAIEMVIRRCHFHTDNNPQESSSGFCISIYVSGFGQDEPEASQRWSIALTLLQHALVQVAHG